MILSIAMIAGIFGNRVAASMGVVAEATFASLGFPAGPAVERQKSYWNGRTGSVVTTRTYEDGKGKHLIDLFRSRHGCLLSVSVGPELTFRGARNFTLSSSPPLTRFCYPRLSNRLAFVEELDPAYTWRYG